MLGSVGNQQDWRGRGVYKDLTNQARFMRRVTLFLIASALLFVFGIILWRYAAPTSQLYLIGVGVSDYGIPRVPSIPYASEDLHSFQTIPCGLPDFAVHRDLSNSVRDMTSLGTIVRDKASPGFWNPERVVICYLKAHGLADGLPGGLGNEGAAYILTSDFDPRLPPKQVAFTDVLEEFVKVPANLRLLVIDYSPLTLDPRLGVLVNQFPEQVEAAVRRTSGDYWVLTAHDRLESPHISPHDRRSVFSFFLTSGLGGTADSDDDGYVDLKELFLYVKHGVSGWVWDVTNKQSTQTPQLLCGRTGASTEWDDVPPSLRLLRKVRKPAAKSLVSKPAVDSVTAQDVEGQQSGPSVRPSPWATLAQVTPLAQVGSMHQLVAFSQVQPVSNDSSSDSPSAVKGASTASAVVIPEAKATGADKPAKMPTKTSDPATGPGVTEPDAKPAHNSAPSPPPGEPGKLSPPASDSHGNAAVTEPPALASGKPSQSASLSRQYTQQVAELERRFASSADRQSNAWTPIDYEPHVWRQMRTAFMFHFRRVVDLSLIAESASPLDEATLRDWLSEIDELSKELTKLEARGAAFRLTLAATSYEYLPDIASALRDRNDALDQAVSWLRGYPSISVQNWAGSFERDFEQFLNELEEINRLLMQGPAAPDSRKYDPEWVKQVKFASRRIADRRQELIDKYFQPTIRQLTAPPYAKGDAQRLHALLLEPQAYFVTSSTLRVDLKSVSGDDRLSPLERPSLRPFEEPDQWSCCNRRLQRAAGCARILERFVGFVEPDSRAPDRVAFDNAIRSLKNTQLSSGGDATAYSQSLNLVAQCYAKMMSQLPLTLDKRLSSSDFRDWRVAEICARLADERDAAEINRVLDVVRSPWPGPFSVPIAGFAAQTKLKLVPQSLAGDSTSAPSLLKTSQPQRFVWHLRGQPKLPEEVTIELQFDHRLMRVRDVTLKEVSPGVPELRRIRGLESEEFAWDITALGEPGGERELTIVVRNNNEIAERVTTLFRLPKPQLFDLLVNGSAVKFAADAPGGLTGSARADLNVFPRATTQFKLELRNGEIAKKLKYQVYKLSSLRPGDRWRTTWPWDEQGQVLDSAASLVVTNQELDLAPGQIVPLKLEPPATTKGMPTTSPSTSNSAAPSPMGTAAPPAENVSGGFVVFVEDAETKRLQRFWLNTRVSHPDRYLRTTPAISYDLTKEMLSVEIEPVAAAKLPAGGSEFSLSDGEHDATAWLRDSAKKQTFGVLDPILAAERKLRLFAEVRPQSQVRRSILLNVDNYPRAFIYDWTDQAEASLKRLDMTLHRVRIIEPREKNAFKSDDAGDVNVKLQADLPATPGYAEPLRIRMGTLLSPDGMFASQDRPREFQMDRACEILWMKGGEPGLLVLAGRVSDLSERLDLRHYSNQEVTIRAEITRVPLQPELPSAVVGFHSVTIKIDNLRPQIAWPKPYMPEKGQPFEVWLQVSDPGAGASGIDKVEVTFPVGGPKQVVPRSTVDEQMFRAKLTTDMLSEDSVQEMLVEATDKVGWSEKKLFDVKILPAKPMPKPMPAATVPGTPEPNRMHCRFVLPGLIDPGMSSGEISISGPKADSAKLSGGQFETTFNNLPPGEYTVKYSGIAKNRQYPSAEVKVVVKSPPAPPADVQLILKDG